MANTYTLIASSTVGAGGASTITFSSIPSTYTDLIVSYSARTNLSTPAYGNLSIRFNNDTGSNYSQKMLYGNGSSALSAANGPDTAIQWAYVSSDGATANTFGQGSYYIPNYTSSSQKSVSMDTVSENNSTLAIASLNAGIWTGTTAINTITITVSGGTSTLKQYSNFYLYGIKNS